MKTAKINLLALMVTTMFSLQPAMAEEAGHRTCNGSATVEAGKMGMVDEAALQAHIDNVKEQLKTLRSSGGVRHLRKEELRRHLSNMQAAMEELHNQMYAEGCEEARHGASVEVRVEVMETRMNMLQQMMEQLIEHMSELEK